MGLKGKGGVPIMGTEPEHSNLGTGRYWSPSQHPAHGKWGQDYLQDLDIRQVVRTNLTPIHLDVL